MKIDAAVAQPLDRRDDGPRVALSTPVLEMQGVVRWFGGVHAVDGVDLAVSRGEIVCLVGPSGCGKSTALRIAAGLESVQAGRVAIDGRVVADGARIDVPPEKRGIGLVFQDFALFPHLTVQENVRFGLAHLPGREQKERAMAALAQVGMAEHASRYPHVLSGGQQQRVALARALAPQPRVLLLDEPFSGLDPRLRGQVRDETLHVLKSNGVATLLVTHDPEEAMFLADRIALMRRGRIEQQGAPVDLYLRPSSPFAATFFGEANRLRSVVQGGAAATPLGPIPARGLADGVEVEVLIRPEALTLDSPGVCIDSPVATVEAARLLGRTSLIHLAVPDGRGGDVHMHARAPGLYLPDEGSLVAVAVDRRQAFVFPVGDEAA